MPIIGNFSVFDTPEAYVILRGPGAKIREKALLDTGFSGFVLISVKDARELRLVPDGIKGEYTIADGTKRKPMFSKGKVDFAGNTFQGDILWIEGSKDKDILVGCELLDNANVIIDYDKKEIRVP